MANLSQVKREQMISFLDELKEMHNDDESLMTINQIEKELTSKKYGLIWEEHEEEVDLKMETHIPVFTEIKEKELIGDSNIDKYNFLLEGDNLHSLKLLEKTHKGMIDVIYIDPPYNTGGNDFIYNDNIIVSSDAFKHSKWLSFMAVRLKVARKLLARNGCIFISIDDNEQAALKLLCDEIFGEECFVANIPWRKRTAKSDVPFGISQDCESILCYANQDFKAGIKGKERKYYETEDYPGRAWRFHDLTKQTTVEERPNSNFTMVNPKTGDEYPVNPLRSWAITKETFNKYYEEGRIIFPGDYDFLKISKPVLRYWKDDDQKKAGADFGIVAMSTFLPSEVVGMTQDGTKEITEIFGAKKFSFPKSLGLIKYLIGAATIRNKDAIVLDFFAGSGTTAQAVLEINKEDEGSRRFILCTNNENNICEEITLQRIKTVITGKRVDGSIYSDGVPANLKYYRTSFVSKDSIDITENLLEHTKEMIQLQFGVKVDNREYVMIMDEDEMDDFEKHFSDYSDLKALFINQDVLLTSSQEKLLKNVSISIIPNCYFDFELREAGELW